MPHAPSRARRTAHLALLGLAVTASIATSRGPALGELGVNGLAALHNGGEEDLVIGITNPAGSVDCELVERHPQLLSAIEWSDATTDIVLTPGRMTIPFETSPDGWTGWPTDDCSVVRIDVEGVGERILFAMGNEDGTSPFFPVYQSTVELADIGENVVTIVPDSPQEFRPTSPDLLFELGDPLPLCDDTVDPGPIDCPDGLCFSEAVPGGVAFAYDGPETLEAATVEGVQVREVRDGTCTELRLLAQSGRRTAQLCGPDDAPELPFTPGDEVEVSYAWPWTGARLTVSSATHTLHASATTGTAQSGLRFEPASTMEPTCVDGMAACPSVGFDAVDLSVVLGESAATPGERVTLPDVTPGREHVFVSELLSQSDAETRTQEILSVWMDDTRVSLSGNIECAPVDLLMVQRTRTATE